MAELIVRHNTAIRRVIHSRSGSRILKRATVEDIFQETITAAMSAANTFEYAGDAAFLGWINTIACRVIARQLGAPHQALPTVRLRSAHSSGVGVNTEELCVRHRSPLSSVSMHDEEHALKRAIGSLSPDHEKVIRLYELEERPLGEVAHIMQRTKGATCRLLARARAALRRELEA